jgi:hypothetical protein
MKIANQRPDEGGYQFIIIGEKTRSGAMLYPFSMRCVVQINPGITFAVHLFHCDD